MSSCELESGKTLLKEKSCSFASEEEVEVEGLREASALSGVMSLTVTGSTTETHDDEEEAEEDEGAL